MFAKYDKNKDNKLDYDEFYSFYMDNDKTGSKISDTQWIFQISDENNDGYLDKVEFRVAMTLTTGRSG